MDLLKKSNSARIEIKDKLFGNVKVDQMSSDKMKSVIGDNIKLKINK